MCFRQSYTTHTLEFSYSSFGFTMWNLMLIFFNFLGQCCWFLWCVWSVCLFYEVLYQGSLKRFLAKVVTQSLRLFICWSCLIALDAEVIGWNNLMCVCRRYFLGLLYVAWTGHLLGFSYFTSRCYWLDCLWLLAEFIRVCAEVVKSWCLLKVPCSGFSCW